ncbi:hypothetical protein HNP82_000062 [Catenibacillus scindens]|uniref:DUF4832 domain-containing protein n=1 Tax=Catenibacillus scindens TaxID=673271 RepID=A0A7W8H7J9_9FIRM|nr:DUF4832 domain-containing protein [Catenibacillus scindens]MBB5262968.1 hypothetical protein [Catenibacillus scindens]
MAKKWVAAGILAAAAVIGVYFWNMFFYSEKKVFTQSGEVFGNPLMGYAPSAWHEELSQDIQLLYVDVTWRELEPEKGGYDWESIEEENQFLRWREEGRHIVLRFVCDIPGDEPHMDIPDWLYEETGKDGQWYDMEYGLGYCPDYNNEIFIEGHRRAVEAMGQRWGGDGLVSFIELGSLGHWGEWHVNTSVGLPSIPDSDVRLEYILPWREAFPNAMILMRRPFKEAAEYGFGLYNDMAGEADSTRTWLSWIDSGGVYTQTGEEDALAAMEDFWMTAPSGGELTSSVPMETLMGEALDQTVALTRASHTTFLGPKIPDRENVPGYETLLENMGYRLWISSASLKPRFGGSRLSFTLENDGVAPFYKDWPVCVYIQDGRGQIVEKKKLDFRLSQLLPGEKINLSVKLETHVLKSLDSGMTVSLGIVDPMTGKDAVRLANEGTQNSERFVLFSGQ